jgi:asparagine synthase (glutamine-hydrolysing)
MLVLTHREITARALPEPIAYWSLAEVAAKEKSRQFSGSYSDAICQLEFLLNRAVGIQATADVAVGAFLSGGIDSSAVVAMMCKLHRGPVHTFSIGMPLAGFDEGKYAAEVASYLGIEHISHTIEASEALDLLPRLPEIWDEPFADSSQIPTLLLCQLASQSVTVALTGDGGDELFLGYNQYPIMHKLWSSRLLRHLPWQTALGFFSSVRVPRAHRRLMLARNVVEAWHQSDPAALNSYWMDRFRHQSNPLFKNNLKPRRSMGIKYSPAEAFALEDAAAYLPDDILVKVDRASMACSLETRAPFLDHRIVEFALSLPLAFKLQGATGKMVLRDMLYKHVPRKLVDRPKMGFSIPLGNWLRIELRPWVESLLADIPPGSDFIRKDVVNVIWQEHVSGYADRSDQLWPILMLLSWSNLNKVVL